MPEGSRGCCGNANVEKSRGSVRRTAANLDMTTPVREVAGSDFSAKTCGIMAQKGSAGQYLTSGQWLTVRDPIRFSGTLGRFSKIARRVPLQPFGSRYDFGELHGFPGLETNPCLTEK
jgi:hypothetical protein